MRRLRDSLLVGVVGIGVAWAEDRPQPYAGETFAPLPDGTPFTWDLARFPQLAQIAVDEQGVPLDPAFEPSTRMLSGPLLALLGYAQPTSPHHGEGLVTHGAVAGWGPDNENPPPALQCASAPGQTCYLPVPTTTRWFGAQALKRRGPAYDPAALPNEGPPFRATVGSFWMMAFEVSQVVYDQCVQTGACAALPATTRPTDSVQNSAPAAGLTWIEAVAFCRFLGGRLPTELEWEVAARGTDDRRWPWGSEPGCGVLPTEPPSAERQIDARYYAPANAIAMLQPPCEQSAPVYVSQGVGYSPHGQHAMAGSVAEWTSDTPRPYTSTGPGEADPTDPRRVVRGGGWLSLDPNELRSAARLPIDQATRSPEVGVRCVWGADAPR